MWLRWLAFPVLALAGLCVMGLAVAGCRAAARLPEPAVHRRPDRLPAQNPAAGLHRGRRADRRIRRGAPLRRSHRRCPRRDETGDPGGRGRALLPAHRGGLPRRHPGSLLQPDDGRQASGGFHHHHAGGQEFLPFQRKDPYPQAIRSAARLQDRGEPHQGPDPRDLHQPDLPRPARLRLRRGRADLFRQAAAAALRRRGGDAGRPAQGALVLQPGGQSQARQAAPAVRAAPHARTGTSERRAIRRGAERAPQRQARPRRIRCPRRVRRRNGAADAVRALSGGRLHPRFPRLYHDRPGGSGGGVCGPAQRPARLRSPPRLPRPGRLCRAQACGCG